MLIGTIAPIRWPDLTKLRYPEHQGFASFDLVLPFDRLASQLFDLCRGVLINSYVFVVSAGVRTSLELLVDTSWQR